VEGEEVQRSGSGLYGMHGRTLFRGVMTQRNEHVSGEQHRRARSNKMTPRQLYYIICLSASFLLPYMLVKVPV
jgi:hypothetical protein